MADNNGDGNYKDRIWRIPYTKEQLLSAVANQVPIIGENGNWLRWDIGSGFWQDTGVTVATGLADGSVTWDKLSAQAQLNHGNLIVNWDFRHPVNRLGQKEYTSVGRSVDRWYLRADGLGSGAPAAKLKLETDGIRITRDSSNNYTAFNQRIEDAASILGKTVTLSILISENESSGRVSPGVWGSNSVGTNSNELFRIDIPAGATGCFAGTATLSPSLGDYSGVTVGLFVNRNILVDLKIAAIKLEFGDKQTLAHQDEEGNWVLNDPPDYDLQYLLTSLYSPTTGEWVGIQHSNPNLFDNWYFVGGGSQQGGGMFPVNQRVLTEYNGAAGYFIDRWRRDAGALVSLTADGLQLTRASAGNNAISQYIENFSVLLGRKLTASALVKGTPGTAIRFGYTGGSGAVYGDWIPLNGTWQLVQYTYTAPSVATSFAHLMRFSVTDNFVNEEVLVAATKLEFGPDQTLAHQDEDGNWVLNDLPNYQEELAKCQRYQVVLGVGGNIPLGIAVPRRNSYAYCFFSLPAPMNKKPTLTNVEPEKISVSSGDTTLSSKNMVLQLYSPGSTYASVGLDCSGLTVGDVYKVELLSTTPGTFILDANL